MFFNITKNGNIISKYTINMFPRVLLFCVDNIKIDFMFIFLNTYVYNVFFFTNTKTANSYGDNVTVKMKFLVYIVFATVS